MSEMKKVISLSLAMVSTMFLAVGATRAAEKFDVTGLQKTPSIANPAPDGPALPCVVGDLADGPALPCVVGDLADGPALPCVVGD
jgi:hypothetical protein